jgi:DNA-directed RNA polymerase subunit M/transcription elongation factor TFIIS
MRLIVAIIASVVIFIGLQTVIPFPYGLILGVLFAGIILWYTKKHLLQPKDSVLNYPRVDPINEKERLQNDEALRILEKKYIEEKISKEEYMKRKKEFEEIEYSPRKCKVCGSEEFEFVSDVEASDKTSDAGYYKCKKCGAK